MGIANIVESHISQKSSSVLSTIGSKLPQVSVDTSQYNPSFVKFMMLVGLFTATKLTLSGFRAVREKCSQNYKPLTQTQLHEKYGHNCWALIVDAARTQNYCVYLAKQGVNLILMGEDDDIKIAKDMALFENNDIKIRQVPMNWSDKNIDYEGLKQSLKDLDIAFLILPKFEAPQQESKNTHNEELIPFEHYYMMFRHFGPVLEWRSYQSAIILPSNKKVNKLIKGNGLRQGLISCMDSWIMCMNYEMENRIQIITNRQGSVEGCFGALGKTAVYE